MELLHQKTGSQWQQDGVFMDVLMILTEIQKGISVCVVDIQQYLYTMRNLPVYLHGTLTVKPRSLYLGIKHKVPLNMYQQKRVVTFNRCHVSCSVWIIYLLTSLRYEHNKDTPNPNHGYSIVISVKSTMNMSGQYTQEMKHPTCWPGWHVVCRAYVQYASYMK